MPIFSLAGATVAGLFFASGTAGFLITSSLVGGVLAFGTSVLFDQIFGSKSRSYGGVSGEIQYGARVSASTLFGRGKVKGHNVFYAKWGSGNQYNADVLVLANGWCDGLEPEIYFGGEKHELVERTVIDNEAAHYGVDGFDDLISIRFYDGRPGQGVDTKLVSDTADLGLKWEATSVGTGLTYVVVERKYDADKFKGEQDFEFVLRGLREYDPRFDSTMPGGSGAQRLDDPSTWEWTLNPAVHRLNYQLGLRGRVSNRTLIGEGKSLGQLDLGSYVAAMNACDALFGGERPTYQASLFVSADDDHTEVLRTFDDAMAGYALNRRGLSGVIAGAPQIPVASIGADDIPLGRAQEVQKRKSAFELFNHMSGQFVSREANWAPESLTPVYVNADIAADGRARQTAVDFLTVDDPDIAQYLLNIRYRQNRKGGSATVPVSRRIGFRVQEGEWVSFDGKSWLVTGWRCDDQLRVTLTLAETGADVYSEDDIEPGPIVIPPTPPVNPSLLSTVQNFGVEAGLLNGSGGKDVPVLRFTWDPPNDPTITAVRFQYKVNSGAGAGSDTELQTDECLTPEAGFYVTTKSVDMEKLYVARATITPVPDRLKTYTAWVATLEPTGSIFADVLDGSIIATKIADAAISAEKLMNEAVTELKLADSAVSTAKIQLAAVTEQLIANGAVIASKLASGAVTLAKFATGIEPVGISTDGTLPVTKTTSTILWQAELYRWNGTAYVKSVAAGDISGSLVNAQIESLAASKITGQLTNSQIADVAAAKLTGQITSTQISDNAISTPKLAAGAITTAKLAAGAVTADELATNAVIAAKIAAGAVETAKLAAGAVTTAKLDALAVTADKIAANAVTADKVAANAITAGKVAAGAISTTELAAGSVVTSKLAVGDWTNLVPNADLTDGDSWAMSSGGNARITGPNTVNPAGNLILFDGDYTASGGSTYIGHARSTVFPVFPGQVLAYGGVIDFNTGATGGMTVSVMYFSVEAEAQRPHPPDTYWFATAPDLGFASYPNASANPVSGQHVVPEGARFARLYWRRRSTSNGGSVSGVVFVHSGFVRVAQTAELIVDGAIIAEKIATNAITTAKIAAGAVTATEIATGAITAVKIAAGAVTADKIAANSITGDKIVANTITAREMILTDFSNLFPGPEQGFVDGFWFFSDTNDWSFVNNAQSTGLRSIRMNGSLSGGNDTSRSGFNQYIAIEPGKDYYVGGVIDSVTGATGRCRIGVYWYDASKTYLESGWGSFIIAQGSGGSAAPQTVSDRITPPSNAVYARLLVWRSTASGESTSSGTIDLYSLFLRRAASAELIVDGSITADKLAVNSITAGKIAAGAINTSSLFVNGVIITDLIAANAVTDAGASVTSGTVTVSGSETSIQSRTINPTGDRVIVRTSCLVERTGGSSGYLRLRLFKGGSAVQSIDLNDLVAGTRMVVPLVYVDDSPSNATWQLRATGFDSAEGKYSYRVLEYLNTKR